MAGCRSPKPCSLGSSPRGYASYGIDSVMVCTSICEIDSESSILLYTPVNKIESN